MKKGKILFILDDFYPIKGAPAIRINSFIRKLSDYDLSVLGGSSAAVKKRNYHYPHRPSERNIFAFSYFLLKMNLTALSMAKKNKYKAIILSIPKYELLFIFPFLKKFSKVLILDVRDSIDFIDYVSYFKHFLPSFLADFCGNLVKIIICHAFKRSIRNASHITVANEGILNSLKSYVPSPVLNTKITLVANGVDINQFQPKDKRWYDGSSPLNLAYIGNFAEKDKFDWLYQTLITFKGKLILSLVGEGRNKTKIISKLKELDIQFKDYGSVEHDQIPAILNKIDLGFIFREKDVTASIPVAIFEFVSMNIPTITNGVGIMADFVKHNELGVVISSSDEFRGFIKRVIAEPKILQRYNHLHSIAEKEYSREAQAELFRKIIDSHLKHGQ